MAKSRPHERTPKAKNKHLNNSHQRKDTESSSSTSSTSPSSSRMNLWNSLLTVTCMAVAAWFGYKGYLETRVNTPYDTEKVRIYFYFFLYH